MLHYKLSMTGVLLLSTMALAAPLSRNLTLQQSFDSISPSKSLIWHPCLSTFFCAVMDVPLNYDNPSRSRAFIPLLKSPATSTPYRGKLLTNPGGPGESGISNLYTQESQLHSTVGTQWDLVSWEPRGIYFSHPLANCSSPASPSPANISRRSTTPLNGTFLPIEIFGEVIDEASQLAKKCSSKIGGEDGIGRYMGTTTIVQDIITILDAFSCETGKNVKDPELLNYWGFSYGTVIGQMFATLHPERVGLIVLDGVVDAQDYVSGHGLKALTHTDEAFSTFFTYCFVAGPKKCAFFTGTKAGDIFERFERLLEKLDVDVAVQNGWKNATTIVGALQLMKVRVIRASYSPSDENDGFAKLAEFAVKLESIIVDLTAEKLQALVGEIVPTEDAGLPEWFPAISCSDTNNALLSKSLTDLTPLYQTLKSQSYIGAEYVFAALIACTSWNIFSPHPYLGPFGAKKISGNMLLVSNTLDPITPIENGLEGRRLFQGAGLLVGDAAGHTSLVTANKCVQKEIGRFFSGSWKEGRDGGLGEVKCGVEAGPFGALVNVTGSLEARNYREGIWKGTKKLL